MRQPENANSARPGKGGAAAKEIFKSGQPEHKPEPSPGQLIDRYGHPHSEAIFRNWTPAAIKALGIRRVGDAS